MNRTIPVVLRSRLNAYYHAKCPKYSTLANPLNVSRLCIHCCDDTILHKYETVCYENVCYENERNICYINDRKCMFTINIYSWINRYLVIEYTTIKMSSY